MSEELELIKKLSDALDASIEYSKRLEKRIHKLEMRFNDNFPFQNVDD